MVSVVAAVFNLNGIGRYFHWHWIQISAANLIVIGVMVVLFVLALLLPFPHGRAASDDRQAAAATEPLEDPEAVAR
jgi:hypothetical protein